MPKLRLGVLGLGRMGQVYAYHAARQLDSAALVAVADPRADVAADFTARVSGGLILDMGIHDFDLIRWYMGAEVERVYTETAALAYPELQTVGDVDYAMISLKFENGALGSVEVSRDAVYGYDIQCEIVGTQGTRKVGCLQHTPVTVVTKAGVTHDIVPHFPQRFGKAYVRQLEHFVECLVHDALPLVTPADARAALQIGVAATRSQHEGRPITVREVNA